MSRGLQAVNVIPKSTQMLNMTTFGNEKGDKIKSERPLYRE
ncbi:hypothetical protein J500_1088 [Acinetobacter sp. 479375]|nr:hypothetical protein J500_1088 [Acinetobacter sp. 479375]